MKVWPVLLILLLWLVWPASEREHPPGQTAPQPPEQRTVRSGALLTLDEYTLTPLAEFDITARVLAREDYHFGREADLSPTDLALGWGIMSDSQILDSLDISQSGRWYRWRAEQLPAPRRDIERSSANMHIVPASDWVADQLKRVRRGDLVHIEGYLIRADSSDGWHWVSSTSRDDTGDGACEIIYAESLRILPAG
ncbi:hypothetical protein CHH28_03060 [Bacterioplanes sanyensis]|uniref:Uncharacterized protein n=1 Tax=Bacterioplanes sanyensis TaxID=1249553 RepID=A0A222FGG2_9GAMM|nr:hypothetical protein [Bacterioplanes sanyensis]ASP37712.1 hypothetical protein CHH28_03060 [Bacterioplanes sanyensis]